MADTATYPITWDKTGERFYETGVQKCVLYPYNTSTKAYDTGYAWNGISTVTESPSGAEESAIYADDIKYLSLRSVEELGGTIEAYMYPDKFAECDGTAEPTSGLYVGQQTRKVFGLCYRTHLGNDTDGDDKGYKLHLLYGATASPSERSYASINDSPEAITFSWEFTTVPVTMTGYKDTSLLTIDSTKVDATKLAALEDILYGKESTAPRLPLPDEVLSTLNTTT